MIFGEGRSRLRTGHTPHLLAALRNLALTLIHRTGSWAIAASERTFAAHPERAFALPLALPPEYSQTLTRMGNQRIMSGH
jgi:hypothetical protein